MNETIPTVEAVERAARQAAVAMRSGWPVKNPFPERSIAAGVWEKAFAAELKLPKGVAR
jgi:hypothetical protein